MCASTSEHIFGGLRGSLSRLKKCNVRSPSHWLFQRHLKKYIEVHKKGIFTISKGNSYYSNCIVKEDQNKGFVIVRNTPPQLSYVCALFIIILLDSI